MLPQPDLFPDDAARVERLRRELAQAEADRQARIDAAVSESERFSRERDRRLDIIRATEAALREALRPYGVLDVHADDFSRAADDVTFIYSFAARSEARTLAEMVGPERFREISGGRYFGPYDTGGMIAVPAVQRAAANVARGVLRRAGFSVYAYDGPRSGSRRGDSFSRVAVFEATQP